MDEPVKKRVQTTKEEKRPLAERATTFAAEEAKRLRKERDEKTARLRALRLARP